MRVIGTAGHVDHGKSTLVRALTGIDPDRLKEEKARGMTIDLGFAWMDLPLTTGHTTPVGIVDVPGHLDFIKNMLAGVGGIDAAVLVIAADEGVMPQTREHLAILDLLAAPALVVALSKCDAVEDADWLDLVELDVGELLEATRFAGARVVRVAAQLGEGLDELRHALVDVLSHLPPRRNRNLPRLPIDRVFTVAGFGTVVTGTLSDGSLRVGDAVAVEPGGQTARVRGMQSHNRAVEAAEPGSRVALNLSGVGVEGLHRGQVVARPGTLVSSLLVDVEFRLLPDVGQPLRHNQVVDFFSGAAESRAVVRLLGREELAPGEQGFLQVRLDRPVVVTAGDRFILRRPSPSRTLGGGAVLNPQPGRRYRRFDPAVLQRLALAAQGTPSEIVAQTVARRPFITAGQAAEASGLDVEAAQAALRHLVKQGEVVELTRAGEPLYLTLAAWEEIGDGLQQVLGVYHAANPLRRGMQRREVRSRVVVAGYGGLRDGEVLSARVFGALVAKLLDDGVLPGEEQLLWEPGSVVEPSRAQQERAARTLARLAQDGFSPPPAEEVLALLDHDELLLEYLLDSGRLMRVGTGLLYRREEFEAMVQAARGRLQAEGRLTLAQARDLWDTSRKYAQAVLEEMDARRITRREGDYRVLR